MSRRLLRSIGRSITGIDKVLACGFGDGIVEIVPPLAI
jgi:hypothetical protein